MERETLHGVELHADFEVKAYEDQDGNYLVSQTLTVMGTKLTYLLPEDGVRKHIAALQQALEAIEVERSEAGG